MTGLCHADRTVRVPGAVQRSFSDAPRQGTRAIYPLAAPALAKRLRMRSKSMSQTSR